MLPFVDEFSLLLSINVVVIVESADDDTTIDVFSSANRTFRIVPDLLLFADLLLDNILLWDTEDRID